MSRESEIARPRWYAVRTKAKEESRAEYNLLAWQVETFHPKMREQRLNQFNGKPTNITKSLFPRYLFARFEAGTMLHNVCYTRGVQGVVNFGGEPIPIEDEIIEIIQSQVGADNVVRENLIKPADLELKFGDKVVIKDGPLKNLIGLFEGDIKDTERVKILLTAISFQGSVVVERQLLQKAS